MSEVHQGNYFESIIGRLYERQDFEVELHKQIEGISGVIHEFDVFVKKRKREIAIEAKLKNNNEPVSKREFSNFNVKLDDTRIKEGHMVTNSYYSESVMGLARHYNVRLIDGNELMELFRKYNMQNYIRRVHSNDVISGMVRSFVDIVDSSGVVSSLLPQERRESRVRINFYQPVPNVNRNNIQRDNSLSVNPTTNNSANQHNNDEVNASNFVLVERPNKYFSRDIGGMEELKDELRLSVIYPITNKDVYEKFHQEAESVLLYGPPGCGKTLLAKAVATESNAEFIAPKISDIMKRYGGDSLKVISSIFNYARENCTNPIIFLDELDSLMKRGSYSYDQRIKNEFLAQMDGVRTYENKPSLMGATNRPWLVDTAIRRPGRFNKLIFVSPPDLYGREQILRIHMDELIRDRLIAENVDELIEYLAGKTEGWSGDDLRQLVADSRKRGILDTIRGYRDRRLGRDDFERAYQKGHASTTPWFKEAIDGCKRYGEDYLLDDIMKYAPKSDLND